MTTLCVLTTHCEWRSYNHKSEVATWRRKATDNEQLRWPPAEPTEVGQRAKCSLAHCKPDVGGVSCRGEMGEDACRSARMEPRLLIHFVAPHGKLYHRLLALGKMLGSLPPIVSAQQHPGPREPHHGILSSSTASNHLDQQLRH